LSKKILKSSLYSSPFNIDLTSNNYLGSYLAGLIEGDGSIIVPKIIRIQKGRLLYPVVKITFVKKDEPLALKIIEVINGGKIVYSKDSGYLDIFFQDLNSIQKIAVLLNGKMRTPKIDVLHRLID
jgi:LAGLIDADG endonuclease